MAKPILLLVAATGFQPLEYHNTKQALEAGGLVVITASDGAGTATASDGTHITVDFTIADIELSQYDGIFLIGGPGALEHLDSKEVKKLLHKAEKYNLPRGAICITPRILAQAGILKNVRATGWDEDHKLNTIFTEHGVHPELDKPVVTDGRIVTAVGPRAATPFGQAIVKVVMNYRAESREG
jgi:protease I